MSCPILGKRLMSALKYVRQGAVFADIGTDHAYLPIYLLKMGLISRAVLSDINAGPLRSAKENAAEAGVIDRVELVLTDGAAALCGMGITDAAIFGMGGELIAQIIENAPFLKEEKINLILQPMSKAEELCDYLIKNGFSIIGESYTAEAGKFYRTICAKHASCGRKIEKTFSKIGFTDTPCEEIEAKAAYLALHVLSLERAVLGKKKALLDTSKDEQSIQIIKKELKRLRLENAPGARAIGDDI